MGDHTSIAWTDATWNPVRGCTKVSPGCKHCYAEAFAERFRGVPGHPYEQGFDVRLVPEALELPLRWKKPRRVFVNSMSDLFHEDVPDEFIAQVFAVMAAASLHAFQVLTKRPERARRWFAWVSDGAEDHVARYLETLPEENRPGGSTGAPEAPTPELRRLYDVAAPLVRPHLSARRQRRGGVPERHWLPWPLPNVWLGVSAENQAAADERIPHLLATPAAVRFLSCEPLLGPVDLTRIDAFRPPAWPASLSGEPKTYLDSLAGVGLRPSWTGVSIETHVPNRIGWVIVGGESGLKARPMNLAWARSLVDQCRAARVACFVKQLGSRPRGECDSEEHASNPAAWLDRDGTLASLPGAGPAHDLCHARDDFWWPCAPKLRDTKGGDPAEWPEDLRVREFPGGAR